MFPSPKLKSSIVLNGFKIKTKEKKKHTSGVKLHPLIVPTIFIGLRWWVWVVWSEEMGWIIREQWDASHIYAGVKTMFSHHQAKRVEEVMLKLTPIKIPLLKINNSHLDIVENLSLMAKLPLHSGDALTMLIHHPLQIRKREII